MSSSITQLLDKSLELLLFLNQNPSNLSQVGYAFIVKIGTLVVRLTLTHHSCVVVPLSEYVVAVFLHFNRYCLCFN